MRLPRTPAAAGLPPSPGSDAAPPRAPGEAPVAPADRVHVLLAHPRPDVLADLSYHLARAGHRVSTAMTGTDAVTTLRLLPPNVVVASDELPGLRGVEIARRLRVVSAAADVAAIVLLEPDAGAEARVHALAMGADDCLPWPGDVRELLLRLAAVTRRLGPARPGADETLRSGSVLLDVGRAEVKVAGRPVRLTRTEFDLLWALLKHPGVLLTRDRLLALAHRDPRGGAGPRRVDRHLAILRAKLGPHGARIETVTGKGYRLAAGGGAP